MIGALLAIGSVTWSEADERGRLPRSDVKGGTRSDAIAALLLWHLAEAVIPAATRRPTSQFDKRFWNSRHAASEPGYQPATPHQTATLLRRFVQRVEYTNATMNTAVMIRITVGAGALSM